MNAPQCVTTWDVEAVRADFPILAQTVHGKPLAYLDNAATTQKPNAVIDAIAHFYRHDNANIHRGVHALAERATIAYEAAREAARRFLNARSANEIVFVRGTTEAINLVAASFGARFQPGDEVIVTAMEHHANIVPWQLVQARTGIVLKVIPMDESGALQTEQLAALITPRTRLVAVTHVSNALGTINPVAELIAIAHQHGVPVLVDGAQAVPHMPVDVQALDADFYCFSGHKLFGPTGIGVLYCKAELLESMPPYQGGGDMIRTVSFEKSTFAPPPQRFEAGTPHIAGAIGLKAAIEYLERLDRLAALRYEQELLAYATERLQTVPGLKIVGTAPEKAAVVSFTIDGIHPHDLGTIVDRYGVAIRVGHHCAMPVMTFFGVPATARASFAFYNTFAEIDQLTDALHRARDLLV
ncbi:cysteine desulfurase [Hydrogenophilus thermoluteolus]|jgi:cysteine desulfurase/selenocysteine lyase|nr:cysteine desulfurase [Hydrogenophilus thermoluteolus]MBW7657532.1 cysteine desulfurase [Hydrogenophilus thermoluteolus]HNQ48388.1 cysteine desulfurase [Hydrogenophilus thermoluteolus]HNU19621.1 cysteine desulfurase [Hydrogenophilus thermoluteolus]